MAFNLLQAVLSATDNTKPAFDSVKQNLESLSASAKSLAGVIGVSLSAAAFTSWIKGSIDAADRLHDLAQITGTSVQTLSGFNLIAAQTGTSLEDVSNASVKMAKTMQTNPQAFRDIGITAKDTTGAMIQLADVFAEMPDGVEKAALAQAVFGKSGAQMIPLLNQGAVGLRDVIAESHRLNPVTQDLANSANRFGDNMARIKVSSEGSASAFANALLPAMNQIVEVFLDGEKNTNAFALAGKGAGIVLKDLVVVGTGVGVVFKEVGMFIGAAAAQLALVVSGDFKGAAKVGDELFADLAKTSAEADTFMQKILANTEKVTQATDKAKRSGAGNQLLDVLKPQTVTVDPNDTAAIALQTEAFRKQMEMMGVSASQIKVYELAMHGASAAQIKFAQSSATSIDAFAAQIAAEKMGAEEVKKFTEENIKLSKDAMKSSMLDKQQQIGLEWALEVKRLDEEKALIIAHGAWTEATQAQFDKAQLDAKARADVNFLAQDKATALQKKQILTGALGQISSLMSSNNEVMFNIGKAASIANASISTIEGATKALSYGPFLGPVLAAAIYAAGAINIAQIASTRIGGGIPSPTNTTFSGGSISNPTPQIAYSAPSQSQNQQQTQVTVYVQGNVMSAEFMDSNVIPHIQERIANSDVMIIDPRSRQAQMLQVATA
jgi:hypothetical protein